MFMWTDEKMFALVQKQYRMNDGCEIVECKNKND